MRWQRLFQDFEDQLDRETDAELEDMARDEERLRIAKLSLADRLRAIVLAAAPTSERRDASTQLFLRIGHIDAECTISRVGRDWMLADISSPHVFAGAAIIPLAAIGIVRMQNEATVKISLSSDSVAEKPTLSSDIGMTFVLRDLCRRRREVKIFCGEDEVSGTIDRVGRDHLDIAVHAIGAPRTVATNRDVVIVPLARVDLVLLP